MAIFMASLCVYVSSAENSAPPWAGLSVQDGVLQLNGKPFRGIGANYFNLFSRTVKDPSDRSYETGLKYLSEAGIPFVRFMACGFWPTDWDLYLQDKAAYFERLDQVVRCAEQHQIGLIPSLFWHMATVPDIVKEPMDQYGNAESRTIAFVRQYTKEMVLRYRTSPAIWAWEFGNEYNLAVDLPNASQHRPKVVPRLGTASHRTERDELSSAAMLTAYAEFAKTVRKYDMHRILITGNSIPRPSAYHNSAEKTWTKDSVEQFEQILLRDNPDPFDLLSVHVYVKAEPDYPGRAKNVTELVSTLKDMSDRTKKPLFIGEFGAPRTLGEAQERSGFQKLLKAIETNRVPLSAFWVYDYPGQRADWNVTWDNDRQYMLSLAGQANRRMSTQVSQQKMPSIDRFNYVLGTQTIGVKYQFTEDTRLVETAKRILDMGSNILKISMGRRYCTDHYSLPEQKGIKSLTDLAQKEPSYREVLNMPFAFYHIWAYGFSPVKWSDGLSPQERRTEYNELYALAMYLLRTYHGTGKTFLIGHWEGDWHLRPGYDRTKDPNPRAIQGMIDWLNIRQKAIDDAKHDTNVTGVHLYHYTEANLVQIGIQGRPCLVTNVLPHTAVDNVSYSSYDTINRNRGQVTKSLHETLDFIESKLPPKPGIPGKRVFIGEYGFPLEGGTTPDKQSQYAQDVCRAALEWGCPYILYWELYCNEIKDGTHRGFWLIDDENVEQPFYLWLQAYYQKSREFVQNFQKQHGRLPTYTEFTTNALNR